MCDQEKKQDQIFKIAVGVGIVLYLASQFTIIPRREFDDVSKMISELIKMGYLKLSEDGMRVSIVKNIGGINA